MITFDHDLADIHYGFSNKSQEWWDEYYRNESAEKTGRDAAKWLIEFIIDNNLEMPEVIIHTRNSSGGKNIKSLFDTYWKLKDKNMI